MGKHLDMQCSERPIGPARILDQRRREVLNYFGTCPRCGYPAQAFLVATHYADGKIRVTTDGSCALPCGWSGPIEVTTMTTGATSA